MTTKREAREALLDAIEANDTHGIRRLLRRKDCPNLVPSEYSEPLDSPLLRAVARCNAAIVVLMMTKAGDYEIDRRYESDDGEHSLTPLAVALRAGNVDVARWLVGRGADVNAPFKTSDSADEAIPIARFFADEEFGTERGVCWWLASEELLTLMKAHGLNLDAEDADDSTALVLAVAAGRPSRVRQCLALGANPDGRLSGRVADSYSLSEECSLLILAVSERIRWQDKARRNPENSHAAERSKAYFDIAQQLLKAGASLAVADDYMHDGSYPGTVLDLALSSEDGELMEWLGLQHIRERMDEARAEAAEQAEGPRRGFDEALRHAEAANWVPGDRTEDDQVWIAEFPFRLEALAREPIVPVWQQAEADLGRLAPRSAANVRSELPVMLERRDGTEAVRPAKAQFEALAMLLEYPGSLVGELVPYLRTECRRIAEDGSEEERDHFARHKTPEFWDKFSFNTIYIPFQDERRDIARCAVVLASTPWALRDLAIVFVDGRLIGITEGARLPYDPKFFENLVRPE